jgi:hypothetical protein
MTESLLWLVRDVGRAKKDGTNAIRERQRTGLAAAVAHARASSPLCRELDREPPA